MQLINQTKFLFTAALIALISIASPALAQDCGLDNWDEDDNGELTDDEFETALVEVDYFGAWDADADGTLTEDEWTTGTDKYLVDYDVGDFSEWDTDDNDLLSDEEFNEGVFNLADENDDNLIDGNDWNTFDVEGDGLFC